jgi:hypothetical protein
MYAWIHEPPVTCSRFLFFLLKVKVLQSIKRWKHLQNCLAEPGLDGARVNAVIAARLVACAPDVDEVFWGAPTV